MYKKWAKEHTSNWASSERHPCERPGFLAFALSTPVHVHFVMHSFRVGGPLSESLAGGVHRVGSLRARVGRPRLVRSSSALQFSYDTAESGCREPAGEQKIGWGIKLDRRFPRMDDRRPEKRQHKQPSSQIRQPMKTILNCISIHSCELPLVRHAT